MADYYKLEGKNPVPINTDTDEGLKAWAMWYGKHIDDRRVARTEKDGITVSTVFLSINHQYSDGPPILFETMIFGGEHDDYQERYSTWKEAEEGHKKACELAFGKEA